MFTNQEPFRILRSAKLAFVPAVAQKARKQQRLSLSTVEYLFRWGFGACNAQRARTPQWRQFRTVNSAYGGANRQVFHNLHPSINRNG